MIPPHSVPYTNYGFSEANSEYSLEGHKLSVYIYKKSSLFDPKKDFKVGVTTFIIGASLVW